MRKLRHGFLLADDEFSYDAPFGRPFACEGSGAMKSFVASAIALTIADKNGEGWCLIAPAMLQMSFHRDRVILTVTVGRLLEHNKERDHRQRRDHQQLVVIDVGDDLRLLRDHGV